MNKGTVGPEKDFGDGGVLDYPGYRAGLDFDVPERNDEHLEALEALNREARALLVKIREECEGVREKARGILNDMKDSPVRNVAYRFFVGERDSWDQEDDSSHAA